jgi:hypothetical protein
MNHPSKSELSNALQSHMPIENVRTPQGKKITVVWEGNFVVIKANGKPYNPFKDCDISIDEVSCLTTYNGFNLQSTVEEFLDMGFISSEVIDDDFTQCLHEEMIAIGMA